MRFSTHFVPSLLPFLLSVSAAATPVKPGARSFELNTTTRAVDLKERSFDDARLTWYDIDVGYDFVVALNSQQFGTGYPGPNCFRNITITVGTQSAIAQIVDNCPGCPYGGLDLTSGLFGYFASTDLGVLTGSWDFN